MAALGSLSDVSHLGSFVLEKRNKNRAIYQWNLSDGQNDYGSGHFLVNKRGGIKFYNEPDINSRFDKNDPLLFKSNVADAFGWGSITKGLKSVSSMVDTIGHYGTIAAKGLDTAKTVADSLSGFTSSLGSSRHSDDFSFDDVWSGVKQGISIAGQVTNAIAPLAPLLM